MDSTLQEKTSLGSAINSHRQQTFYTSSIGNKHEVLDGGSWAGSGRDLSNQDHIPMGGPDTDKTVQTIDRANKVLARRQASKSATHIEPVYTIQCP